MACIFFYVISPIDKRNSCEDTILPEQCCGAAAIHVLNAADEGSVEWRFRGSRVEKDEFCGTHYRWNSCAIIILSA